jgi:hypothetical protein
MSDEHEIDVEGVVGEHLLGRLAEATSSTS